MNIGDDDTAPGAARGKREVERPARTGPKNADYHPPLVARIAASHKHLVPDDLFDLELRRLRRDRAFRQGPELFLYERAFDECLDRLAIVRRHFQSALLIGCPDPSWPHRLGTFAERVEVHDPGPCFAKQAGGSVTVEDRLDVAIGAHDLCLAVGTLDTVNDLPQALVRIRAALGPDSFFLGAASGGETLPRLRAAMRAGDALGGVAVPHVHPRIEAPALAALLSASGFANPVVDLDRAPVSYPNLASLVADLRAMGATNVLQARSRRPLSRAAARAAAEAFATGGENGRTTETFEILHFAAWTAQ